LNAPKYFVGFVADNVSYAETAFQLPKESFPGIIKINCMAHILNLISKEVTSIEYWPRTHAVLNALKQFFVPQHSSEQRGRQQRFHQHFKFSAHNTFNFIETRWSEWLQMLVLVFVSDHHRQLSLFIGSEKEHSTAKAFKHREGNNVRSSCWEMKIEMADSLVKQLSSQSPENVGLGVELAVLASWTEELRKLIKIVQTKDSVEFCKSRMEIVALIQLWRSVTTDQTNAVAATENMIIPLIKDTISANLLIANEQLVQTVSTQLRCAISSALSKFDNHAGQTMQYLEALQAIDPQYFMVFSMQSLQQQLPMAAFEFAEIGKRKEILLEWKKLCQEIVQNYQIETLQHTISPVAFWQKKTITYPALSTLAFRLLSLRQGIAEVERLFSILHNFQTKERQSANISTIEAELFIAS